MFRNYFNIAIRNFLRNKSFSLINVTGLAISISAALLIYIIVAYEFSFDKFHAEGNRIFRITTLSYFAEEEFANSGVPTPMAEVVRSSLKGVEEAAAFHVWHPTVSIPTGENEQQSTFRHQERLILTDEHYFDIFSYQWIAGSPASLQQPFRVVLTESRAKQYFSVNHAAEVLGREIVYNDSVQAVVAGIVRDIEQNTDFTFQEFISLPTIIHAGLQDQFNVDNWDNINSDSQLFIRLAENSSVSQVETQLSALLQPYISYGENFWQQHQLQPLADLHFNPKFSNFNQRQAHKPTLYSLQIVALFLLLLGCINFINLTTAQSGQRAKEISVRKTFGSGKNQLIIQFMGETLWITAMASLLALLLVPALFHVFRDFLPPDLVFQPLEHPHMLLFLLGLVVVVGLLAGFYPALVLSRLRPVWLIKSQGPISGSRSGKMLLRQLLIVFQFVVAISLLVGSMTVSQQIRYALQKDMGFKGEAVITFSSPFHRNHDNSRFVLLEKIRSIPDIEKVSLGGQPPASDNTISLLLEFKDGAHKVVTSVDFKYGGPDYLDVYELKLLAGRNLLPSDTVKEFLINETYAKILGFPEPAEAVGQLIQMNNKSVPVVGVVADFHMKSMHVPIQPTVITTDLGQLRTFHVALARAGAHTSQWDHTFTRLAQVWKEVYPDEVFDYRFMHDSIAAFYQYEQHISHLLRWATGLAIFISCLGLFGLASFTAASRTKEIGIRKVLGANVSSILLLLSKGYIRLIFIALLIAIPIANYFMTEWLQNFTYRIEIRWWLFALPGILVLLIALFSVSSQTVKAARQNPVDSRRYE